MKTNLMTSPMNLHVKTVLTTTIALLLSVSAQAMSIDTHTYSNTGSIQDDGISAMVNDTPIFKSDIKKTIERLIIMYQSNGKPIPNHKKLKEIATNQLIMRELQLDLVKKMGFRPKETRINVRLMQYAKKRGFNDISELQKSLDSEKAGSYALLRKAIIDDLSIKSLQSAQVNRRVDIQETDIDIFLASPEGKSLNENSYQTVHVRIPYTDKNSKKTYKLQADNLARHIQSELRFSDDNSNQKIAEIIVNAKKKFDYSLKIQGGNMGYHHVDTLPIDLASKIVRMKKGQVSIIKTKKGIDVIKLADKKVTDDLLVPQWRTRHILVAINDFQTDKMAEYKINEIYKKLAQGENFAKLSATYSDDPSSAGAGGNLDWVSEGSMVKNFEIVMKRTPKGSYSRPFKTEYGWHILQVVDTRNYDASNDVRRAMAKEILFKREASQAKEDWLEELKSVAYVQRFD